MRAKLYGYNKIMKIKDLADFRELEIAALLARIPFFKDLQVRNSEQLATLLRHSCLVELEPGETIMRRGDKGSWLYFLIRGNLNVYLGDTDGKPLNHITPGELFGDLALLCDHERKATVAAEKSSKTALLFATDFKPFGDLKNYQQVDLQTKLIFYRTMVHSIRWRLEVHRMSNADSVLASELRRVPTFSGVKDHEEELLSLFQQAQLLAGLLDSWNRTGSPIEDIVVTGDRETSV